MARDETDQRTGEMFEYLEDAEAAGGPQDPDQVLTDEDLEAGGLVKTQAFIRTRQSRNALRVKRHQERKAEEGIGQCNVQAPRELHDTLKAIGKRTKAGEDPAQVLADVAGQNVSDTERQVLAVLKRGGIRAWLMRLIAGA
jgi:hypothetical protein